jgi:hypothetical protein
MQPQVRQRFAGGELEIADAEIAFVRLRILRRAGNDRKKNRFCPKERLQEKLRLRLGEPPPKTQSLRQAEEFQSGSISYFLVDLIYTNSVWIRSYSTVKVEIASLFLFFFSMRTRRPGKSRRRAASDCFFRVPKKGIADVRLGGKAQITPFSEKSGRLRLQKV